MSFVSHIRYIDEYNKQRALLTDSYPSFVCTAACNAIVEEELAKAQPQWVFDRDPVYRASYTVTLQSGAVACREWSHVGWILYWSEKVVAWMPPPEPAQIPEPKSTTMWLGKDAPELESEYD